MFMIGRPYNNLLAVSGIYADSANPALASAEGTGEPVLPHMGQRAVQGLLKQRNAKGQVQKSAP